MAESKKEPRVSWRIWIPKALAQVIEAKARKIGMTRNEYVARTGSALGAEASAKQHRKKHPMPGVFRKRRKGKHFREDVEE